MEEFEGIIDNPAWRTEILERNPSADPSEGGILPRIIVDNGNVGNWKAPEGARDAEQRAYYLNLNLKRIDPAEWLVVIDAIKEACRAFWDQMPQGSRGEFIFPALDRMFNSQNPYSVYLANTAFGTSYDTSSDRARRKSIERIFGRDYNTPREVRIEGMVGAFVWLKQELAKGNFMTNLRNLGFHYDYLRGAIVTFLGSLVGSNIAVTGQKYRVGIATKFAGEARAVIAQMVIADLFGYEYNVVPNVRGVEETESPHKEVLDTEGPGNCMDVVQRIVEDRAERRPPRYIALGSSFSSWHAIVQRERGRRRDVLENVLFIQDKDIIKELLRGLYDSVGDIDALFNSQRGSALIDPLVVATEDLKAELYRPDFVPEERAVVYEACRHHVDDFRDQLLVILEALDRVSTPVVRGQLLHFAFEDETLDAPVLRFVDERMVAQNLVRPRQIGDPDGPMIGIYDTMPDRTNNLLRIARIKADVLSTVSAETLSHIFIMELLGWKLMPFYTEVYKSWGMI